MKTIVAESDLPKFEILAIIAGHGTATKGMLWWKKRIPFTSIILDDESDAFARMCAVAGVQAPSRLRAGFFHEKDRDAFTMGSYVLVTIAVSTPAQREHVNAPAFRLDDIQPCT